MTWVDVINTAVGLTALGLGGFAIWLSLHLYTRAKESEKQVAITLEAIRAQSDALQKLTGRWMDRFTRHATEPRPADEGLLALVSAVAALPTTIITHLGTRSPQDTQSQEALIREAVDGYIGLYYYSALTNVVAQALLPLVEDFDDRVDWHVGTKRIIDQSAQDFNYLAGVLNGIDRKYIDTSRLRHLLDEAVKTWQPDVRDSRSAFAAKER